MLVITMYMNLCTMLKDTFLNIRILGPNFSKYFCYKNILYPYPTPPSPFLLHITLDISILFSLKQYLNIVSQLNNVPLKKPS